MITPEEIAQVLDEAAEDAPTPETENKRTHAQLLIDLAVGEFFHDDDGRVFVRVPVQDHFECYPLRSTPFRSWLTNKFYHATGTAPSSEGYKGALGVLEARGIFHGEKHSVATRLAQHDGAIYLDIGDDSWAAVEITTSGWSIRRDHPVRFIRSKGMRPVIPPVKVADAKKAIEKLRYHINVNDYHFALVVAWLVQALRPSGPYPVLGVTGEHGSAKSTAASLLRKLIDPNMAPLRSAPTKERDLAIACGNSWAVVFDNLTSLPGSLSDALCRVATGGGFSTRKLYQDDEEQLFSYMRPIILNGIASFIFKSDLADRAITIDLEPIPEDRRKPESQVNAEFERDAPVILGGLLTAVSTALANIDTVTLPTLPRMADFALWVEAAEPALPWARGEFQIIFERNRESIVESSLEGDLFGDALLRYFDDGRYFAGTAAELLAELENFMGADILKKPAYRKLWPQSHKSAGRLLKQLATFLRRYGFEYHHDQKSRPRIHILQKRKSIEQ